MAATVLRDAYDCIVLGRGPTAQLLARGLAGAGRSTLLLQRQPMAGIAAWLHPRWTSHTDGGEFRPLPLTQVAAIDVNGGCVASLTARNDADAIVRRQADLPETCSLPEASEIRVVSGNHLEIYGPGMELTFRAQVVFSSEAPAVSLAGVALGGVYRDAVVAGAKGRQATLFATRRAGEVCWQIPLDNGLTSLGLWRDAASEQPGETLAEIFEEALVACPHLTRQLVAAELVGSLDVSPLPMERPAESAPAGSICLPEYESWFDPVFASGWWLAEQMARQIVALVTANGDDIQRVRNSIASWRANWPAVEQLTRERIAPWYRLDASLPAALRDLAQRSWYEHLLGADSQRASLPEIGQLHWESRPLFLPRRTLAL